MSTTKARKPAAPALLLDRFVPYRLAILSNLVSGAIARAYQARFGIAIPEWRIIAVLGLGEALSANQVGARTEMDKVQVSRAVRRLLQLGLISRAFEREDRRRSRLALSKKGQRIYAEVAPFALATERDLLNALSTGEHAQLDALLTKLTAQAQRMNRP